MIEGRRYPFSRPKSQFVPWLLLSLLAFLALGGAAQAALRTVAPVVSPAPAIRIEPTTLYFGAATPPPAAVGGSAAAGALFQSRTQIPQALRDKAATANGVRVLVRLATPFTPEGGLAGSHQVQDQRQGIGLAQSSALAALAKTRAKLVARYRFIPFLALQVDADALDALSRLPQVTDVQEDVFERPSLASSTAVIGAGVAWSLGFTGSSQVVAILDTGVDKTHPYFSSGAHNKVVSEACYSSGANGTIGLCPGAAPEATGPGTGVNCDVAMSSDCEHGTHVAGIAAANDGINFGVARDADLISIQVFSAGCGGACLGAWISDEIKGLERVYELADQFHIAAVNMSLGGAPFPDRASCDAANAGRKAAIDNLRSVDIATVAAAGNDFSLGVAAPACISSAVGVGATDDKDVVASFSNIASFLDLMAPGVGVESSVPGGGTAVLSGTSMSTPHVAGAWAVLKQQSPEATVSDLLALLRNTAVQVGGFGFDLRRINLGKAVATGPFVARDFVIHNDGNAVLSVLGMQLDTPVPWIRWDPEAPFDVPAGGSRQVSVAVDFSAAPAGTTLERLVVASSDGSKSPYPDAVHLVIGKQACYALTRTRMGNGGFPDSMPSSSPGCLAGQHYAGEVIQLKATPSKGWALQSWSGTDNDASTAATNTLAMPAAPHTVSATYYAACFALTRTHTGSGGDPAASPASSSGCPSGQYKYGETIHLTANPDRGWRVGSWTSTDNDASRGVTNTLAMPPSAVSVAVNYLEGVLSVLLVDATGGSSLRSYYTDALVALGRVYDVWDVSRNGSPDTASLASYPRVVWAPGPYSGPTSSDEASLAAYLDGGGSLFISGQDYVFVRGFTPFMSNYLGLGSVFQDRGYGTVTGGGTAFSGLGPYGLTFTSFPNFADLFSPAAGAETAFNSPEGSAGVSKVGLSYRTIFLGFPFETLPTADARRDVMGAALDFLGTIFGDVPRGYWAKKWIEAVYRNGVSSGCSASPRLFCPESPVNREQMALFLLVAKEAQGYTPPPCTTAPFNDVAVSSPFCPWIKELAHRGVTAGCGNGNFCPKSVVTRKEAAVLLLATKEGAGYVPPACTTAPFGDMPVSSPFCPWVKELAHRGITGGCGSGNFCPADPNKRAQMAVFLVSTFHLPVF